MARRLTDTGIWAKNWYRKLSPVRKCLFKYVCDNCDHAGFMDVDFDLIAFQIGEEVTKEDFDALNGNIHWMKKDKIWVSSFVCFQYKVENMSELNPQNNAHKGVLSLLKKNKIPSSLAPKQPLIQGAQDKDKERDKEKEKEEFEKFRKKFPGTKEGLDRAFENFWKKSKPGDVEKLMPALNAEIAHKEKQGEFGSFVPQWKNLKTWINGECWEQELGEIKSDKPKEPVIKMNRVNIKEKYNL